MRCEQIIHNINRALALTARGNAEVAQLPHTGSGYSNAVSVGHPGGYIWRGVKRHISELSIKATVLRTLSEQKMTKMY